MSFDHRASIVAFIEETAEKQEAGDMREWASRLRALASSVTAGLDMEPGRRDVASPLHAIASGISGRTRIAVGEILGKSQRQIVLPSRYALLWIANRRLGWSTDRLTKEFGYSDPSSTKHAISRANEMRETDAEYRHMLDELSVREYCCENCGSPIVNV